MTEQSQAKIDRSIFLNWKPARGRQMAFALVDALIKSPHNRAVEQRIAGNVQRMR